MSLLIGIFDTQLGAYAAMNALTDLGLDPVANEVEEVSSKNVANEMTDLEQHPEVNAPPGSVQSLGAPLPPPDADPSLSPGPLGQAYVEGGQEGLIGALREAGFDRPTAARMTQMVEDGGALIVVRGGHNLDGARQALTHAGAHEIVG